MAWMIAAILAWLSCEAILAVWRGFPVRSNELGWALSWVFPEGLDGNQITLRLPWRRRGLVLRSCQGASGEAVIELQFSNQGWRAAYQSRLITFCRTRGTTWMLQETTDDADSVHTLRAELGADADEAADWLVAMCADVFHLKDGSVFYVKMRPPAARGDESSLATDSMTKNGDSPLAESGEFVARPRSFVPQESSRSSLWVALLVAGFALIIAVGATVEVQSFAKRVAAWFWRDELRLAVQWAVFLFGSYALGKFSWELYRAEPCSWRQRSSDENKEFSVFLQRVAVRALVVSSLFGGAGLWADSADLWWALALLLLVVATFAQTAAIGGRRQLDAESDGMFRPIPRAAELVGLELRSAAIPILLLLGVWIVSWHQLWMR